MCISLLQPLLKYKKILLLILTTTGAIASFVWNYDLRSTIPMIILTPNKLLVLRVGLTLLLAIMFFLSLLFLSLYASKPKANNKNGINLQEFTFVDPPGYYTHPGYSYPICPSCLIKTNSKSPVSKEGYCTVCKEPMSGTRGVVFNIPDD